MESNKINPNFEEENETKQTESKNTQDSKIFKIIPSIIGEKRKSLKLLGLVIGVGFVLYQTISGLYGDSKKAKPIQKKQVQKIKKDPSDQPIKQTKDKKKVAPKSDVVIETFNQLEQAPLKTDIKIPDFEFKEIKSDQVNTPQEKQEQKFDKPEINTPSITPPSLTSPSIGSSLNPKDAEEDPVISILSKMKTGPSSKYSEDTSDEGEDMIVFNENYISKRKQSSNSKNITKIEDQEFTIPNGTIIHGSLTTGIDSELSGSITALIAQDVFGQSGETILIPRGSKAIGSYTTTASIEETRIGIIWTKILRPDGVVITLDAYAADQLGKKGIEADIDNRYGDLFQNSLLLSFLTLGTAVAAEKFTGASSTTTTTPGSTTVITSPVQTAFQSIVTTASAIAQKMSQKYSTVNPKLTVPHGTTLKIIVNADIESIPPFKY